MNIKLFLFSMACIPFSAAFAEPMSVNFSLQGNGSHPAEGYRMTYHGNDGSACIFRFKRIDATYSHLVADKKCPSYVTEHRVFMDAQRALKRMRTVSTASTYAEYAGDDGYGNPVPQAKFKYRCATLDTINVADPMDWAGSRRDRMSGYVFMPISDPHLEGWYVLDRFGHKSYQPEVGAWKLDDSGGIVATDRGRVFSISELETFKCYAHRAH